ncbi:HPP family protein [Streptacidiphilus pinicola]|uniref:HPP family protein n=1 Tax=Streptacidiphilus pinicola TaxID=2219663 RepID=A0A2X0J3Z4_9ACTN|nr:HPP family protein [Streptacidiphilus pinicola]RAG84946.1 HPP family protein [Streptacidiphilus pinicola]
MPPPSHTEEPTTRTLRPSLHALRAAGFAAGALLVLVAVGVLLHQPLLIPPLAASAALVHGAPGLPISQPRNLIGGQLLSALIGFGVLALTGPSPWGAALAAGLALGVMLRLGLSHSPAAATSVIVVLQAPPAVPFLALLLVGTVLLVAIGLLPGRIAGHPVRYPVLRGTYSRPKPEGINRTVDSGIVQTLVRD